MSPVKVRKKDHKYEVRTPGGVKAKGTTKEKAEAQARLLRGVEHGMIPRGSKPAVHKRMSTKKKR